ncbi:MAG: hypothetical protein DMF34_02680, partial [Verrucomicrobia bacterium]
FAKKNSSQADLDQAMANLHQAEANVKIKQGALDKAKADLDHCSITSPVDGVVISRNVDVGQTVAASLQAPVIFTIANDLTKMQIDSNVAEADVGAVVVDQTVDFTVDAFPNRTFHGKVVQVRNAPIAVQNVVTYDTVIGVSNPDLKLKPRRRPANRKCGAALSAGRRANAGPDKIDIVAQGSQTKRRSRTPKRTHGLRFIGKPPARGADQDRNQRRSHYRSCRRFEGRRSRRDG